MTTVIDEYRQFEKMLTTDITPVPTMLRTESPRPSLSHPYSADSPSSQASQSLLFHHQSEIASPSSPSDGGSEYGSHKMKTARPYRSHKYPACARCHKRRSRCTIEVPGQACLLCRMHGVPCSSASNKPDDRSSPKIGFIHRSMISETDSVDELSHIVGPIIARDTQVLEQYLPDAKGSMNHVPIQPNTGRREAQKAIYRAPVPPQRPYSHDCSCARNMPVELFEQVHPFLDKLVAAFYQHSHPCFPITEEACVLARLKDNCKLPANFLTNLIASSIFYWDITPTLSAYAKPSIDFAWSVAVATNIADIQKSDIGTIIASTINIAGRPSKCVVSNTTNVARIVALSHAIGLNHDCSEWKIPDLEKRVRWRAWWGVVLHDRWFNFAQGTPPYISKGHYDVPLPSKELLCGNRPTSNRQLQAAEVYIHLCRLTEIIGDVLPLIYHIRSGNDSMAAEQTSRSEIELNRWIESRPAWLNLHEFHNRAPVPGLVNLQLSFLAVRMLLRRIAWHEISQRETEPASSWLTGCQTAAEEIVRFVTSLQKHDLQGFWLPYNAHHFTSAVTLLLRCALQTSFPDVRNQCMGSARTLVDCLRRLYEEENWDLAETALSSSETILRRIEEAMPKTSQQYSTTLPVGERMDQSYMSNGYAAGSDMGEDLFNHYQSQQGSIEELFPEIFSDFSDTALLGGSSLEEVPQWNT